MGKPIFLLAMLLSCLFARAQQECKDIIYPAGTESIIFNCCIYEVTEGNLVHFVREGDSLMMLASSIVKDGLEIKLNKYNSPVDENPTNSHYPVGLYRGHDFEYYYQTYQQATSQRNAGIGMTFLGLILEVSGFMVGSNSNADSDQGLAIGMILVGSVFETVGVPLWISGGIKRANNQRVMDDMKDGVKLSFGATKSGLGLVLKF